eukprot:5415379-Pyramimonas_sp.AAC.1
MGMHGCDDTQNEEDHHPSESRARSPSLNYALRGAQRGRMRSSLAKGARSSTLLNLQRQDGGRETDLQSALDEQ